jgi:hypothetical protein
MRSVHDWFGLKREAVLLDSRLYIVKAMAAVATGYLLGRMLPVTRLDMISVLVGVMYNLEPINISGVKGGIDQLAASALAAIVTGFMILLFGINVLSIALSMGLTILIGLRINWRQVSPVAIFTSVYMTQFVQMGPDGIPSIFLTFRLRILALGLGIAVALFFNFLFSYLYYRNLPSKRLEFVKLQTLEGLRFTRKQIENRKGFSREAFGSLFSSIFNNIDMVNSNFSTMRKEPRLFNRVETAGKLDRNLDILWLMKEITHLTYDTNYFMEDYEKAEDMDIQADSVLHIYAFCIDVFEALDFTLDRTSLLLSLQERILEFRESGHYRILVSRKRQAEHGNDGHAHSVDRISWNLGIIVEDTMRIIELL